MGSPLQIIILIISAIGIGLSLLLLRSQQPGLIMRK
jgi:hypothetical protein